MNESLRTVDARGQACPQPVILTRKALAEGGFELLEVVVDDDSSKENVVRFASYANCVVESVTGEGPVSRILIRPAAASGGPSPARVFAPAEPAAAESAAATTVFIASAGIGGGDEQLAALLMRAFLYTLTEAEALPARIILMNGGVRLAVEGSESLVNLRRLAERGVEILACGTCLEFYQLKDALAVGRVSNMYEIAGLLLQGRTVRI
ncbi:MAG: sulfurtransferase-like selenium metabolism protein YedF [Holophaga sp.]|nr:sulfurtransferase-like selenium metabolism protein YedF [Holophaga sp.]